MLASKVCKFLDEEITLFSRRNIQQIANLIVIKFQNKFILGAVDKFMLRGTFQFPSMFVFTLFEVKQRVFFAQAL